MAIVGVAFEAAGADLDEGNAAAVIGVHVRVNLEDEAGERRLLRLDESLDGLYGLGRRGDANEAVEQLADAKVVQRGAEEDRGDVATEVGLDVERGIDALDQLDVFAELRGGRFANAALEVGVGEVAEGHALRDHLLVGAVEIELALVEVVDALEAVAHFDGPAQGADGDLKLTLDLVEEVEGGFAFTVELVDEDDDGRLAHAADFHQFAGLCLDTFGGVNDDDDAIDGGEGAISVFGEVLVAGGVEDVDLVAFIVEGHGGGGDGDAALLFDLHPVGGGGAADLVRLHGAGYVDGAAEEEELLGEGGLTGVGVADDGEGAAAADFVLEGHKGRGEFEVVR